MEDYRVNQAASRRSVRQLVLKNTSAQLTATALSLALSLFITAILSRYLGVIQFGKFNYLFAFYYFFLAISDFGVNTVVIREASRHRSRTGEILGTVLSFKLGLSLVSLIVAWSAIQVLGFTGDFRRGLILYGLILPILAFQLPSVIYQIDLRPARLSFFSLANKAIGFLFVMTTVMLKWEITGLVAGLVAAEILYTFLLYWDTRRLVSPVWRLDWKLMAKILHSSIPIGVTGLLVAVINRFNFVLLERAGDLHQLGLFSAASKVTTLLETLPLTIMATLYPLMSCYAEEDFPRLRSLYGKSLLGLGLLGLAAAAVVSLFSPFWIRTLFGKPYAGAAPILAVLVWSTACLYPAICGGNLLISVGRERANLVINSLAAVLSVSLNVWMIPRWGALGASWAALITYGFIFACTLLAVQDHLRTAS
jgi:PST family polysaccharide transporter